MKVKKIRKKKTQEVKIEGLSIQFFRIIFHVPRLFHKRLTFTSIAEVKTRRDVYYSTIFALSSAALAFLPQLAKDGHSQRWLFIITIIGFGLTLFLVIAIHFVHILFIISQQFYEDRKGKNSMEEVLGGKNNIEKNVTDALEDAFTLMSVGARMDLVILLSLFISILSYVVFLILNFF